jgi:hypothetical protein
MSKTREVFTTPVGRLVQGDCFEAQTKDQQGNPRVVKQGPNVGQPNPTYFIAVAFPKLDAAGQPNAEFSAFYGLLDRVARAEWPALFPNGGACVNPKFSWKYIDGDGVDTNGKPNSEKEGFAGHWVVRFASSYAPKVMRPNNGSWESITDKNAVKRGYFVRVAGSISGNDNTQNPGLYVNLDMIELAGYGPEIMGGMDAATAFGAPAALPPGASATPILPAGIAAPVVAPAPVVAAPLVAPAPVVAAPVVAAPLVAPVPVVASPVPPVVPPSPSALPATISPSRVMTAAAAGQTYEAYIAAGWTDDQLVAHGYMVIQ